MPSKMQLSAPASDANEARLMVDKNIDEVVKLISKVWGPRPNIDFQQDTIQYLLETALPRYQPPTKLSTFIFSVAKQRFFNKCRREKLESKYRESKKVFISAYEPQEEMDMKLDFRAEFAKVPAELQVMLRKRFLEDKSYDVIGHEMKLSTNNVFHTITNFLNERKKIYGR